MKWEYRFKYLLSDSHDVAINETIRDIDNYNAKVLDDLGNDGWELVSVDNGIAYFKRPLEQAMNVIDFEQRAADIIQKMMR